MSGAVTPAAVHRADRGGRGCAHPRRPARERATTPLDERISRLVPGTDWVLGIQASMLEPFTVLAHAAELSDGAARRLAQYRVGAVQDQHDAPAVSLAHGRRHVLVAAMPQGRGHHVVLVFARRAGEFTSAETRTVREALPALREQIDRHVLRTVPGPRRRGTPALCVLSSDLRVEYASADAAAMLGIDVQPGTPLPEQLARRIGEAIADWSGSAERCRTKTLQDDHRLALRIFALDGAAGLRIGVLCEPTHRMTAAMHAVERYGMTRREVQILNLLAHGASSAEIAERLHIVESTVNEHIARMMQKTEAANRVELVARVLETPEL